MKAKRAPRLTYNPAMNTRARLDAVAKAKAAKEGRPCGPTAVLTICVNKHLPALEQELGLKP